MHLVTCTLQMIYDLSLKQKKKTTTIALYDDGTAIDNR